MASGTFLPPGLSRSIVKIESGGTDNYVMTAVDGETIQGESALQFDGSNLLLADTIGMVIGHTAQETISIDGSTDLVPELQVLGTGAADASLMLAAFSATATIAGSPILAFVKSGDAAIDGTHVVVTDDEELGNIVAYGDDGTDLESIAAQIQFEVDGTPGTGVMPGRIVFATTADDAEAATERMRIDSVGSIGIGTDDPYALSGYSVVHIHHATNGGMIMMGDAVGRRAALYSADADTFMDVQGSFNVRVGSTPPAGTSAFSVLSTGEIDFKANALGITSVGYAGSDWTANEIAMDHSNTGGTNLVRIENTATAASSQAQFRATVAATDNATVDATANFAVSGTQAWIVGVDNSESDRFAISNNNNLGAADVLRFQVSDGEMSLTVAHSTSYFDYVCDSCGKAEIEMFTCCGVVAWHDDVLALRELQLSPAGIQHMAKLGIYEIDGPDTDAPGSTFINFQKAMKYTWAGMYQNRERMDAQNEVMDERLKRIEQALGV